MFNDDDDLNDYTRFISAITSLSQIEEIENIRDLSSKKKLSINSFDKIINNKNSKYNNLKINLQSSLF